MLIGDVKDTSGVYAIKNTKTGNQYIGSSTTCRKRIQQHFSALRHNRHYNKKFQFAFNKYGEEAFVGFIVEYCALESRMDREQYYIDLDTNNLYNLAAKAKYCPFGRKLLQSQKDHLSNINTGLKYPNAKRKQSSLPLIECTLCRGVFRLKDSKGYKRLNKYCSHDCWHLHERFLKGDIDTNIIGDVVADREHSMEMYRFIKLAEDVTKRISSGYKVAKVSIKKIKFLGMPKRKITRPSGWSARMNFLLSQKPRWNKGLCGKDNPNFGRKFGEEHNKKMKLAAKNRKKREIGWTHSDEVRKTMSIAQYKRWKDVGQKKSPTL